MELDGVAGEVLYPSQGLFYFKVADTPLMSAIFARTRLARRLLRTDPARLKGIAMINLDDIQDGLRELERAARLGLAGAMITEYPARGPPLRPARVRAVLGRRRRTRPAAEPAHATRRQGKIRGPVPERCATPAAAQPRRSIRHCRCAI